MKGSWEVVRLKFMILQAKLPQVLEGCCLFLILGNFLKGIAAILHPQGCCSGGKNCSLSEMFHLCYTALKVVYFAVKNVQKACNDCGM